MCSWSNGWHSADGDASAVGTGKRFVWLVVVHSQFSRCYCLEREISVVLLRLLPNYDISKWGRRKGTHSRPRGGCNLKYIEKRDGLIFAHWMICLFCIVGQLVGKERGIVAGKG